MKIDFQYKPGSTIAKVTLEQNETVTAEGGAMVAMSQNIGIETTTYQKKGAGGIMSGVKRLFASESLFFNHFTAKNTGDEIYLGTSLPGDMELLKLSGKKIYVEGGSYVASSAGVTMNTAWQGAKNFISGESLFWIELSGEGDAIINAFGVIYPIDIDGEYIVDTGHIVAYEEGMNFEITKAGTSWIASFLGGEGFVCKFRGKGRVWCQSHSSTSWGQAMTPHLKAVKK
jgi:uncharacterized protein (TIGR00266 family)